MIVRDLFLRVVDGDIKCLEFLDLDKWEELWTHKEMKELQIKLLNDNLQEEQRFHSLPLKIRAQQVYHDKEHIGYQIFLNPIIDTNNTLEMYADERSEEHTSELQSR